VLLPKTDGVTNPELAGGNWITRFEPRTLSDIEAIVQPSVENERRFATVQRVSEINLDLYRRFLQPLVRTVINEQTAEGIKKASAIGSPYEMFSSQNPFMPHLARLAEQVRENRQPVSPDNPLLQWQKNMSDGIVAALENFRVFRDQCQENIFLATYSSPVLQAIVGVGDGNEAARVAPKIDAERAASIQQRIAELKSGLDKGGVREAAIRSWLYIGMVGPGGDERTFNELRLIRAEYDSGSLEEFKQTVREQYFLLMLDKDGALAAIPKMLPADSSARSKMLNVIRRVVNAAGKSSGEHATRLTYIEYLFADDKKA
jgi:hypothetical protein